MMTNQMRRYLMTKPLQVAILSLVLGLLASLLVAVPASSQSTTPGVPSNVNATTENLKISVSWEATTEAGVAETDVYYIAWINLTTADPNDPNSYDNIFINAPTTTYEITTYFGSVLMEGHEYSVCLFGYNNANNTYSPYDASACASVVVAGTGIQVSEVVVNERRGTTAELLVSLDNPELLSTTVRLRYRTAAVGGEEAGEWSEVRQSTQSYDFFSSYLSGLTRGTTYEAEATTANDFTSADRVVSTTFATVAGPVVLAYDDDLLTPGTTTLDIGFVLDNPDMESAVVRMQYRTRAGDVFGEWNVVAPKTTTGETIVFNLTDLMPDTLYRIVTTTAADFSDETLNYRLETRTLNNPIVTKAEHEVTYDSTTVPATVTATVTATLFNPDGVSQTVSLRYRALSMPDYESRPSQTITGTSVAFVLGNLTLGTQYLVQVSLDDSFETGVLQTGFTTLDVPDEPRVASVTAEDQALTVKWNAPSDDGGSPITGYRVQWKVLGEEEYPTANVEVSTANVREVTIRNLENDVTYVVHVQAENEFGPGEWSGEAVGRPNDGPRVESVSATLIRDVSAQVTVTTWYVTSSNRSVYLRFRPQNGTSCASTVNDEDWSRAAGIVSSFNQETAIETVISLAGLAPSTLYCLQASLASTFTDGVIDGDEFRTESKGDPAPPTAPQVGLSHGNKTLRVNWLVRNDGGADITGYKVTWWPENTQDLEQEHQLSSSDRSYLIGGLENGTTYNVRVIATNSAGDSPPTVTTGTPSTVPGSEVTGLAALGCDGAIDLSWNAPSDDGGSPITGYRVQWKSGFETYRAERQVFVTRGLSYTLGSLMDGTEYTVRVLGVNANGGARDENATPLWSLEVKATPPSGACIAKLTFGNILSDSAPIIVEIPRAEEDTQVNIRYRSLPSGVWSEVQSKVLEEGETSVTFDIRGLKPSNLYEVEAWLGSQRPTENRVARAVFTTGSVPEGSTFTGGGGSRGGRIMRIEPSITSMTVGPGDVVVLSVQVWGRQNLLANDLADKAPGDGRPEFTWFSDAGGSFSESDIRADWRNGLADDREVRFTAPSDPGSFVIRASLDDTFDCLAAQDGETADEADARCSAEIEVTVRRPAYVAPEATVPVNPSGPIPEVLADTDGVAYAVFTPVDGGSFVGEGYWVTAEAGAVADGEYIGLSMTPIGEASNMRQTWHRYTLAGQIYEIGVVDASGSRVSDYALGEPADVCMPLPVELRSNISDIVVAATNDAGGMTVLSSTVKVSQDGIAVCGKLSSVPANVAVGKVGSPPTDEDEASELEQEEELPDTGATAPGSSQLILLLILGAFATLVGLKALTSHRRKATIRWK